MLNKLTIWETAETFYLLSRTLETVNIEVKTIFVSFNSHSGCWKQYYSSTDVNSLGKFHYQYGSKGFTLANDLLLLQVQVSFFDSIEPFMM